MTLDAGDPMRPRPSRPRDWLVPLAALALLTALLLPLRGFLERAHVVLLFLLVPLVTSARVGRGPGLAVAIAAFLSLNFFFVPPYHTLTVAHPLDWLVLAAFLLTSAVAAQLFARAQHEAAAARLRAAEVDRLSAVGAEALNAGRAEDALARIAEVVRSTLGVAECAIHVVDRARDPSAATQPAATQPAATQPAAPRAVEDAPDEPTHAEGWGALLPSEPRLLDWVGGSGQAAAVRTDGTLRVAPPGNRGLDFDHRGARVLLLPLMVHDRPVGVLRIADPAPIRLDAARARFVEAIAYYAALGVERVRLVAEAEHAEALRQADELKNALLASVSHDLRTPLTTIKALAHELRVGGSESAATIEQEADRLNRFVADLLDLSRLTGGAFTVSPELNAAEDLLGAVAQRTTGALADHPLEIQLDPHEPLLLGRFDFVHSLRILVNLVENAAKYSPAGSAIELVVRRDGGTLAFVVSDRGPGVAAEEVDRIFEPFYRPPGTPPDVGGTGLGLSIAQRMAIAQGGTVRYAPRPGGGSVFTLRLPAAELADAGSSMDRSL